MRRYTIRRGPVGRPRTAAAPLGMAAIASLVVSIPLASATVVLFVTRCPTSDDCTTPGTTAAAPLGAPRPIPGDDAIVDGVIALVQQVRAERSVGCRPARRSSALDAVAGDRASVSGGPSSAPLSARASKHGYAGQVVELVARGAADTAVLAAALARSALTEPITDCARVDVGAAVAPGVVVIVAGTPTTGSM